MPATIGDILSTKRELVTTTPDVFLYQAIELMMQHDYSQLPVLDPHGKPIAMLTSDSIVRALHHFHAGLREPKDEKEKAQHLRVRDAMNRRVETCKPEDEVFAVHRQLRDSNCVLVLDDGEKLVGIVTGYDTTEYLRQRVQDIVFVQDIEERIKQYVTLAFRNADGSEDRDALQKAIGMQTITAGIQAQTFKKLLDVYLKRKEGLEAQIDEQLADRVLLATLPEPRQQPQDFEHLSLHRYISLFLQYGLQRYGQAFPLERQTIFRMLDSVRQTRNNLAHLKIDISARARDELRHCREWLADYYDDARAIVIPPQPAVPDPQEPANGSANTQSESAPTSNGTHPVPETTVDEAAAPNESRYTALGNWLYALAADQDRIQLSFGQIEQIIGGKLPQSAREYRSWWANDTSRSRQSEQWLSAGWRTDEVDVQRGRLTFVRLQARERAYSSFFEAYMNDLREVAPFPLYQASKVGYYWQSVTRLPDTVPAAGFLTFAFTRAQRPRVDLYIDTGDRERNKQIFDQLRARSEAIEAAFGAPLAWERIDDKKASRIACYYDAATTIHSSPEELAALRSWGVEATVRLYGALDQPTREVLAALDAPAPAPDGVTA